MTQFVVRRDNESGSSILESEHSVVHRHFLTGVSYRAVIPRGTAVCCGVN